MKIEIAPSLLAANFLSLEKEIEKLENTNTKWLHLDVMDGVFVDNITFGYQLIEEIRKISTKFFDVHLMVQNPQKHIEKFILSGSNLITFHIECSDDIDKLINSIKNSDVKVGISIKPDTDINELYPYLDKIDLVLVMSVNPGFGGQKLIPSTLDKVTKLKEIRDKNNYSFLIEIDGGVNLDTYNLVKDSGVDIAVIGSYLFNGDINTNINRLGE